MSNPQPSSAVVFSGYLPIEVTQEEFQRTVEVEDVKSIMSERKKRFLSHRRSITKKIGELLSSSTSRNKKKSNSNDSINNVDNDSNGVNVNNNNNNNSTCPPQFYDGSSIISGVSNQGQQSVANRTVDSASTIKASNLHLHLHYHPKTQTQTQLSRVTSGHGGDTNTSSTLPRRYNNTDNNIGLEAIAFDDDTSTSKNSNRHSGRQSKPWKSLKRLVVKGRCNNKCPSSNNSQLSHTDISMLQRQRRNYAKSYDEGISTQPSSRLSSLFATAASSSSLLINNNNDYPMRQRIYSEGVTKQKPHRHRLWAGRSFSGLQQSQQVIDNVIRGRLDGMDLLNLGPASRDTLPALSETKKQKQKSSYSTTRNIRNVNDVSSSSFDPLHRSFSNLKPFVSTANIVDDMIWSSAGKDPPEIILEGFFPGGSDRWSVRIGSNTPPSSTSSSSSSSSSSSLLLLSSSAERHKITTTTTTTATAPSDEDSSSSPPALKLNNTTDEDDDESLSTHATLDDDNDGSANMPIAQLWYNLWGVLATPPPIPTHMQTIITTTTISAATAINNEGDDPLHNIEVEEEEGEVDEIQQLTENCNVPIDLDDDAFIIDSPTHLRSVHDLIMVPLQSGRLECAISIFEKLQRGLEGANDTKFVHLIATTAHNIGMIQLCQKSYEKALVSFRKAVQIRKECLPSDHPDIAVSLNRQGLAHFALSSIDEALRCFEAALKICTSDDNTRAKILNNLGVARYQLEDYAQALKLFTSALEIQRPLLDGPIRRECMVYDASTTLSNMGKVYLRQGDYDLAYFVFEEACLMQTSTFRKDHDIVLSSLDNMARSHTKNENFAEALRIFTSLRRSQEARFGRDSEICIETIGMMGTVHFKLLEYEEAFECMKRVTSWQSKRMERSHPSVQITNEQMSQVKRCLQGEEPMWV